MKAPHQGMKIATAVWALLVTLPIPIIHRHEEGQRQPTLQLANHLQTRHQSFEPADADWHLHWLWLQDVANECNPETAGSRLQTTCDLRESSFNSLDRTELGLAVLIEAWGSSHRSDLQPNAVADSCFLTSQSQNSGRGLLLQISVLRC
jgi:hypothetical protein